MDMRTGKMVTQKEYDALPEHEKRYYVVIPDKTFYDAFEAAINRHERRAQEALERRRKKEPAR